MDNMAVILMSQTFIKTECRGFALFKDYAKRVNTTVQKKLCQVELVLLVQRPSTTRGGTSLSLQFLCMTAPCESPERILKTAASFFSCVLFTVQLKRATLYVYCKLPPPPPFIATCKHPHVYQLPVVFPRLCPRSAYDY